MKFGLTFAPVNPLTGDDREVGVCDLFPSESRADMFVPDFKPVPTSRRRFLLNGLLGTTALFGLQGCGTPSEEPPTETAEIDTPTQPVDSPIVDTHMHIWANDFKKYPVKPGTKEPEVEATAEILIEEMDQHGVDYSVIVQVIYHGWDNEYVADMQQKYPDRFRTQGLIDPEDPNVVDKLAYWVEERGLHGMRMSAIYYQDKDDWITSEAHHKLWQRAADLGAVFNFFIKTHQLPELEQMVKEYPEVKVAIDHFAYLELEKENTTEELEKLLRMADYSNVSCKLSEMSTMSLTKEYPYADTFSYVKQVFDTFGADRLMWGTGFPGSSRAHYNRPTVEEELDLVRKHLTFLNEEDKRKILGENAYKFWKFGPV
ncbi:MAG: amidohydrolase [Planctomycetaceae bacterium]|nr:amidohydrolase [Planctomycetaceae bacterium]